MTNSNVFFHELENYRTPRQMRLYFEKKKAEISSKQEYRDLSRLKTGRFKEFLEEFYPLYLFSQSMFVPEDAELRIVIGNQPYDGLIRYSSGEIQKLEFTEYIEGYLDYQDAISIKERGYSKPRMIDTLDLQSRAERYKMKVIANAKKKAKKNYEGVILIITVNTFFYLDIWELDTKTFIQTLLTQLRQLQFNSESLYVITLNNDPIEAINNNIYKVF